MAEPSKPQPAGMDRAKMKQYLVPAGAVLAVLLLAGLVVYVSGAAEHKMSDGSSGSADDPGLKEASAGVKYRDIKEGLGEPCPEGAAVTMHYTGWLTDGTVFDSSKEGKATALPLTSPLKGLIRGWQEGVPGMKKNGIRKLVIAPEKGYGAQGSGKKIPANSTLIFEVELLEFSAPKNVVSGPGQPMPSDKSNGGTDDPGLKDIGDGLKYRDLKEGAGDPVKERAEVTIHYTGWTADGTVFDDSRPRGAPNTWPLGDLVRGWQKGIPGMKPGGIRKLVVPAALGYGETGQPPKIPGGATLVFEVELVK